MKKKWQNWSKSVTCFPKVIEYPSTEEQIAELVKKANLNNQKIRVVGSGHSFSPIVETNDILVSLDKLSGLIQADINTKTAELWAGTKVFKIGDLLLKHNLALEIMGDYNQQSIAGALSTGTHGTGIELRSLSNMIEGITLVNGNGEIIKIDSENNPQWLDYSKVSLGMFGIITRIKLRLVDAYKLNLKTEKIKLKDCLAKLDEYKTKNRNFEFYYFPHTEYCQIKCSNISHENSSKRGLKKIMDLALENYLFGFLCFISKTFNFLSPGISKLSAWGISKTNFTDWSYNVYATTRLVKFQEMEYNIPVENFTHAILELKNMIVQHKIPVNFPIECRFVKKDNIALSPAYERESAYIAVHQFKGMPYKKYFKNVEEIMHKYNGRPHWGKIHFCDKQYIQKQYPKMEEFISIRSILDPKNIFINTHLQTLFT